MTFKFIFQECTKDRWVSAYATKNTIGKYLRSTIFRHCASFSQNTQSGAISMNFTNRGCLMGSWKSRYVHSLNQLEENDYVRLNLPVQYIWCIHWGLAMFEMLWWKTLKICSGFGEIFDLEYALEQLSGTFTYQYK